MENALFSFIWKSTRTTALNVSIVLTGIELTQEKNLFNAYIGNLATLIIVYCQKRVFRFNSHPRADTLICHKLLQSTALFPLIFHFSLRPSVDHFSSCWQKLSNFTSRRRGRSKTPHPIVIYI